MTNWEATVRKKKSKENSPEENPMMLWGSQLISGEAILSSYDANKFPANEMVKSYQRLNRYIRTKDSRIPRTETIWISEARAAATEFMFLESVDQESILLDGEIIEVVNYSDEDLIQEIEESKYIYDLDDDWDDEGSQGYEITTWKNAVQFLIRYANQLYTQFELKVEVPSIEEGPDGSIDLIWQTDNCRLIANIPNNTNDAVQFYGDDRNQSTFKGTIQYRGINDTFILWLKNLQKNN